MLPYAAWHPAPQYDAVLPQKPNWLQQLPLSQTAPPLPAPHCSTGRPWDGGHVAPGSEEEVGVGVGVAEPVGVGVGVAGPEGDGAGEKVAEPETEATAIANAMAMTVDFIAEMQSGGEQCVCPTAQKRSCRAKPQGEWRVWFKAAKRRKAVPISGAMHGAGGGKARNSVWNAQRHSETVNGNRGNETATLV